MSTPLPKIGSVKVNDVLILNTILYKICSLESRTSRFLLSYKRLPPVAGQRGCPHRVPGSDGRGSYENARGISPV